MSVPRVATAATKASPSIIRHTVSIPTGPSGDLHTAHPGTSSTPVQSGEIDSHDDLGERPVVRCAVDLAGLGATGSGVGIGGSGPAATSGRPLKQLAQCVGGVGVLRLAATFGPGGAGDRVLAVGEQGHGASVHVGRQVATDPSRCHRGWCPVRSQRALCQRSRCWASVSFDAAWTIWADSSRSSVTDASDSVALSIRSGALAGATFSTSAMGCAWDGGELAPPQGVERVRSRLHRPPGLQQVDGLARCPSCALGQPLGGRGGAVAPPQICAGDPVRGLDESGRRQVLDGGEHGDQLGGVVGRHHSGIEPLDEGRDRGAGRPPPPAREPVDAPPRPLVAARRTHGCTLRRGCDSDRTSQSPTCCTSRLADDLGPALTICT